MTVVCKFDDIESGTAKRFDVNGTPVAVVRIDDEVFAIGDICSHANVSLSDGEVWCDTKQLECPRHSSSFSLLTGVPETLPATQPVPVYVARVIDGNVDVEVGS
ncbi:MAG: non-heme iron oxygenase ferredoxin subunit [Ilumatobacteraceae bacterium]|nr:non-heme iron oxygenase ferredoxin subunit [Actinomycetota bacterium]MDA3012625.1 non-heme iron oxygenase ferredoxin subunit [Actinomycetota bacterium]